jgi:hypothetical protein
VVADAHPVDLGSDRADNTGTLRARDERYGQGVLAGAVIHVDVVDAGR